MLFSLLVSTQQPRALPGMVSSVGPEKTNKIAHVT